MGKRSVNPSVTVGTYVQPKDWNSLIKKPNTVIIDTRNHYEVEIGTFNNALNPKTNSFREFPAWVTNTLEKMPNINKKSRIAMFCTGGIRCEKATSFLKEQGYQNVFHLEGGILKYCEELTGKENLWKGECFVFDERVSLDKALNQGKYVQCFGCRRPLSEEDLKSKNYLKGVSCSYCYDVSSDSDKERFAQRQKQIDLAEARGYEHMGATAKQNNET